MTSAVQRSTSTRGSQPHGAHKINNVLGQALLTKELGKTRVIAETGAGPARCGYRDAAALLASGLHDLHGT